MYSNTQNAWRSPETTCWVLMPFSESVTTSPGLTLRSASRNAARVRVGTSDANVQTRPFIPSFTPDGREIERVLEVPLARLRDPAIFRTEIWERNGEPHHVQFYQVSPADLVWGATARILLALRYSLAIPVAVCPQCGSPTRAHRMCPTCKTYKGREIEPLGT